MIQGLPDWNELFKNEEFRWRKPHPSVVDLVRELEELGINRVLDLGCGAGRHTIYLSEKGFEVVGIDPAQVGLVHSAQGIDENCLPRRLVRAGMDRLPFANGSFQCVISIYVIHHNNIRGIERALEEIDRVLLPEGLVLVTVLSKGDFKHGDGRQIEDETFITAIGPESGVPHHFFSREELAERFGNFEILRLVPENIDRDLPGGKSVHHEHWEVLGLKLDTEAKKGRPTS